MAPELAALPAAEGAAIGQFFALRDYAPFWTEPGSDAGGGAGRGARRERGAGAAAGALRDRGSGGAARRDRSGRRGGREVAASRAYLRFAGDLSAGVLDPGAVVEEITRKPARPAPAALLAALEAQPVAAALQGFEPQDPDYARLMAEKARLEIIGRTDSWGPAVAAGPTLHPGDSDPRVAELRARLARLGYVVPAEAVAGTASTTAWRRRWRRSSATTASTTTAWSAR